MNQMSQEKARQAGLWLIAVLVENIVESENAQKEPSDSPR
jgi:hypothetical protein